MYKLTEKIISWLPREAIEPDAIKQIENIASLPIVFKHVAVMPDCHVGKGATVGTVIATQGAVVPAAVGVDIGCGMIAVKTPFTRGDLPESLHPMRLSIERRVPAIGRMPVYNSKIVPSAEKRIEELHDRAKKLGAAPDQFDEKWPYQLGSLGGGNHFIEITLDEEGGVWAFLHSGSRGVGNKIATHFIGAAKKQCRAWGIELPDPELAYLREGTEEFEAYMSNLLWAQHFALLNREEMMERVLNELRNTTGREFGESVRINCHHNFTQLEEHFGAKVWLTRKGAISARSGELGLIPGSMGTASYIVAGKGNETAFYSSPHGAGRRFSRTKARAQFTIEDFDRAMAGIEARRDASLIDELPAAYKDIDEVMRNSAELVEVKHTLRQILNVKGA